MSLNGAVVSDSWTLVLRKNASRAREVHFRARTAIYWLAAVLALILVIVEVSTSWFEARLFSAVDRRVTFSLQPGASEAMLKPAEGPYDQRLGFTDLGKFTDRLENRDFEVKAQARTSVSGRSLAQMGMFPIYHEPSQAGLRIEGWRGNTLLESRYPAHIYPDFKSIPPLVVNTLLFIENRQLRDNAYPYRNPAVEWQRTGMAMIDLAVHTVDRKHQRIGGSTLATQLEKMRHSAGGETHSVGDKFRQMISASLRAYLDGSDTRAAEEQIICDYINSIPLAATPAQGEVLGLADGLEAWYGTDTDAVNRILSTSEAELGSRQMAEKARVYRQVLSLFLAMRAPSLYLVADPHALAAQTDRYLRVLAGNGIISTRLRDSALKSSVQLRPEVAATRDADFVADKAPNAVRMELLPLLGLDNTYALDRLDLTVRTTLDTSAQGATTRFLEGLSDPSRVTAANMNADQLLDRGNPQSVVYSFTLYEHKGGANLLRVQTDNLDQPLDINQGTKLQLGSTAKLRTLVNYLQIVAQLHKQYAGYSKGQLESVQTLPGDHITEWALNYLYLAPDRSLRPMLEAALQRKYSGSTGEAFFTAGGLQTFENFERSEDKRNFTVSEGFQLSVNLVFIRLLRDIENYYKYRVPGASPTVLTDWQDPARLHYLARFADMEGRAFLRRFYEKYKGQTPDQALEMLVSDIHLTPLRAAVLYRSVRPNDQIETFRVFLERHFAASVLARVNVAKLYNEYGPDKFSLQDRGYLAHVHPLELWLVSYQAAHPQATFKEMDAASAEQRQQVYQWLFMRQNKASQNSRIATMLEIDAFKQIHSAWQKLGYPFNSLVPSYATAIGVSGDTPAALAKLVGVILNDGVLYPKVSIEELHFAEGTPFETLMTRRLPSGQRKLNPVIAELVRREMIGVVQNGTGRRMQGGIKLGDGPVIPVGGKTGTGDNEFHVYSANGALLGTRNVNRTAAFTFFIGDRFFGTALAFVSGKQVDSYGFTSALAVQLLKDLTPDLAPLLEGVAPDASGAGKVSRSEAAYSHDGRPLITPVAVSRRSERSDLPQRTPGIPLVWSTAAMAAEWRFPLDIGQARHPGRAPAKSENDLAAGNRAKDQKWLLPRSHRFRQFRVRGLV